MYSRNYKIVLVCIGFMAIAFYSCKKTAKNTVVTGEILPVPSIPLNQVTLIYSTDDSLKVYDSIKTGIDGKFTFKVKNNEPSPLYLIVKETGEMAMAFSEGDSLKINAKIGAFKTMEIQGGKLQTLWNDYTKQMMPFTLKTDSLNMLAQNAKNEAEFMKAKSGLDELQPLVTNALNTFLKNNGNSMVASIIVYNNANYVDDYNWINEMYGYLGADGKNNKYGKRVGDKLAKLKSIQVGSQAPDFSSTTPDGKTIKLSDFRGKYVLLDFWASWCGPCRQENPNVVNAYNSFKNKNFEVFGVSLDHPDGKTAWLEAIEKDGLIWKHASELKGWESSVADLYSLVSIPSNFLLDPKGKIIARNLREDSLHIVLQNVLNTNP